MEQSTIAAKIDELATLYRIPDGGKIKEYLAACPELVDVLLEAYPHIALQFGSGAIVELRFPRDYENDRERDLLAMIQSNLDADAALDRLDTLWDEWWGDASGRRDAWPLYIGVEYAGELVR
jgi:hypothetical protein